MIEAKTTPRKVAARNQLKLVPRDTAEALLAYHAHVIAAKQSNSYRNQIGEIRAAYGSQSLHRLKAFTSSGEHWEVSLPSAALTTAAHRLSREMNRIMVAGEGRARVLSEYGPGRVRAREVMRIQHALSNHEVPTRPRPFSRQSITYAPRTPLRVGFMLDTSYSQDQVSLVGARTAWMTSEAVRRVNGKVSMSIFGQDAWLIMRPGEHLRGVPRFTMVGGGHRASLGYELIDVDMRLADTDGARVLIVFSDGQFADEQFTEYLAEAELAGVAVLVLSNTSRQSCFMPLPKRVEHIDLSKEIPAFKEAGHIDADLPGWEAEMAGVVHRGVVAAVGRARSQ